MNQKELKEAFDECKKLNMSICVAINLPDQDDNELIINSFNSLTNKLDYYKNNYDDNLHHKQNNDIKIVAAFPIRFFYDEVDKVISEDEE